MSGRGSRRPIPWCCTCRAGATRSYRPHPRFVFGLIEGLTFKGKCYSALAQMLGTRSVTERLAHLLLHLCDAYGVEEGGSIVIGTA